MTIADLVMGFERTLSALGPMTQRLVLDRVAAGGAGWCDETEFGTGGAGESATLDYYEPDGAGTATPANHDAAAGASWEDEHGQAGGQDRSLTVAARPVREPADAAVERAAVERGRRRGGRGGRKHRRAE